MEWSEHVPVQRRQICSCKRMLQEHIKCSHKFLQECWTGNQSRTVLYQASLVRCGRGAILPVTSQEILEIIIYFLNIIYYNHFKVETLHRLLFILPETRVTLCQSFNFNQIKSKRWSTEYPIALI